MENLTIYILELLPENEKLLIEMEQKYLDMFEDKYNINPKAGKTRLGAKHSEETKGILKKNEKR